MNGLRWNRRKILRAVSLLPLLPYTRSPAEAATPTPACAPGGAVTATQTPGPFFTPDSPLKADFTPDAAGRRVSLAGYVIDRNCRPLRGAVVDLWHANADGDYDNQGFRLRGHQMSDGQGRYAFTTIEPGNYGVRTKHYHVRISAPGRRGLTTQLYFPGNLRNTVDTLHRAGLEMRTAETEGGREARFDFILGDG